MPSASKAPTRKRGRPRLPPEEGKRHPINMRTTKEVREKLEAASRWSGRSLAQEVEYRIEQAFRDEAAESDYMGGPHNVALTRLIGTVVAALEASRGRKWTENNVVLADAEALISLILPDYMKGVARKGAGQRAIRLVPAEVISLAGKVVSSMGNAVTLDEALTEIDTALDQARSELHKPRGSRKVVRVERAGRKLKVAPRK